MVSLTVDWVRRTVPVGLPAALCLLTACGGSTDPPQGPGIRSILVSPQVDTIFTGAARQLSADIRDVSGHQVTDRTPEWTSSNSNAATVNAGGLVTAVAPGQAAIRATLAGVTDSARITVLAPVASITLSPDADTVLTGDTTSFTATLLDAQSQMLTDRPVTWFTVSTTVATVTPTGRVTGVTPGSTFVVAAAGGRADTAVIVVLAPVASVDVSPAGDTISVSDTTQLVAVARDSAGGILMGRPATWTTGDSAVATVSPTGLVTGRGDGTVTITATVEGVSGTATIRVLGPVGSVQVTSPGGPFLIGATPRVGVVLRDTAGNVISSADRPLTWTSSDTSVAEVSPGGRVTGYGAGTVSVTAATGGKSDNTTVTFNAPSIMTGSVPLAAVPFDLAYDAARNRLYLSESAAFQIGVFDLTSLTYLTPIAAGTDQPMGLDLSTGNDTLLVALPQTTSLGIIDLTAPSPSVMGIPLTFDPFLSRRPDRLRVMANDRVIIALTFSGSGFGGQILEYDLATGQQRRRTDVGLNSSVTERTPMARALTRRLMLLLIDDSCCPEAGFIYNADTDTFTSPTGTVSRFFPAVSASRDASRYLIHATVFNANLVAQSDLGPALAGAGFSNGTTAIGPDRTKGFFAITDGVLVVRLSDGTVLDTLVTTGTPTHLFPLPHGAALVAVTPTTLHVLAVP